ncbi:hypothetical protein [Pseudomonas sp. PDM16]|uniref:hypothetical protein n=1 Tax=Pseudomonas sp. PDM16 TaxID=2769292 RepID=UPI00298C2B26|nr:hypothetical protein [Pseudomonas sp. PDM16]
MLNSQCQLIGKPWRGNLRRCINQASDSADFISRLLGYCALDASGFRAAPVVLAIDTPLGFSTAFIELLVHGRAVDAVEGSSSNPYLFRQTERFLFERGLSPLSAVKDMIGSQATKGMHALARFAPDIEQCGVWTDNHLLSAIEAYPASCKRSSTLEGLRTSVFQGADKNWGLEHVDQEDALTCALIAWLFHFQPEQLAQPCVDVPRHEGWIFVPEDGLASSS